MKTRQLYSFALFVLFALLTLALLINNSLVRAQRYGTLESEIMHPLMENLTIYGDLADGEVLNRWCNSNWNSCRNASTGNAIWQGLTVGTVGATLESGGEYTVQRIFLFFDTSSIPTNAQITGAVLNVYAGQYQNGSKTIHISRSTASIPLTTSDFSKVEFVSGGSATPSSPYTWISINLNATALNWIAKGGMTKLALIHHMDLNNIEPTIANDVLVGLAEDSQHRPNLVVTYSTGGTGGVVGEARLDIGMPYNANRGCSSPYVGCGGRFHGFYAGVCTDLAMDAYNAGVPFDIQSSLSQDHLANPGRYRYGTARNAEDMRRYFNYNQQLLAHSQAYQLGDIAFFDWTGDGITNHANIISEVDSNGRPLKMVDATGVYSGNPSGLAFEHNWSSYYDQHSQGHARLSGNGVNTFSEVSATETLQILRVTVGSPSVTLRLSDENGKSTSEFYDENLVVSNVESFIPYIPGGSYFDLGTQKTITVTQPLSNTTQYFVQMEGQANVTYNVLIETLEDSNVSDTQLFTETIGIGESQGIGITLSDSGGVLEFTASSPATSPVVSIPNSLDMSGLVGTSEQLIFDVAETGGQQPISNVSISVTDLANQLGGKISSSELSIAPTNFSVITNDSQSITIQVDMGDLEPGVYQGSLILTSQNAGSLMIPFTLEVQFHNVYLPVTMRN